MGSGDWPSTPWTIIRLARAGAAVRGDRAALERLLEIYYEPVERFFRRVLGLGADEAGDVTHDLFARLLERDFLDGLTHETSFRGFLKVACRRRCASFRAARAAKTRALRALALVPAAAAAGAPGADGEIDAVIDDELRRSYVDEAARRVRDELQRQEKPDTLAIFEARTRFDGSRPEDYAALAERFGLRIYDVRNRLTAARRIFRRELLRIAAERADDPKEELREIGLLRYVRT